MTFPEMIPRRAVADWLIANVIEPMGYEVALKDLQTPPPSEKKLVGVNLSGVYRYGSEIPWNDVMKTALWRGQDAVTMSSIGEHYPAGNYESFFDGDGLVGLAWNGAAVGFPENIVNVAPNDAGIRLKTTGDVSNVKLMIPGSEGVWRQGFLDRWRFASAIRFMNWQRTNHSTLSKWADRTTMLETQAGDNGVALEHMIDLCNQLRADPWFCIPHLADDEFVTQFAQMCKDLLTSDRTIYVEDSNEVWNGHFAQSKHATEKGIALGYSEAEAKWKYHGDRTVAIGEIFRQVLGRDRIVVVLSGQAVNTWGTELMLERISAENIDAFAIAPYIGIKETEATATTPISEILGELFDSILGAMRNVEKQKALIGDLPLFAYEGGQHMVMENNDAVTAKLIEVSNDPGMQEVYAHYLSEWEKAGGDLFMHFQSTRVHGKHGSWGLMEHYDSPKSGKYLALVSS